MTIPLCCPVCRGPVDGISDGYRCPACRRTYPLVFGIPDFRVAPPERFDLKADLEVAAVLAEEEPELDFEGLVELYYRLRPEPSDELHEIHMAHVAGEEEQARTALDLIEAERPFAPGDAVLEVGCGLGQYIATAAERVEKVAAVDLSLAFLILTRKRLEGRVLAAAAAAEKLPFPDQTFAAVIAADVIEHLDHIDRSLEEMGRVLASTAPLFLSTPNRFSLAPEPHVGLWGVGYLPRALAGRYVHWRRRIDYSDVRLLSAFTLRRALRRAFPGPARVLIPGLSRRQLERFHPLKRGLATLYLTLRRLPLVRGVFHLVGPFFHAVAVKK